ncbi:MAG: hypothetical protein CM1200mP2_25160 [Planctomycetaceae bacterium]|nr:MAG: hypothetical protein CM1200mP2_25160 [Planctomycetaceae bacterium]
MSVAPAGSGTRVSLEPLDELVEGIEHDFQPRMFEASRLVGSDGVGASHAVPLCGWVQVLVLNRAAWDSQGLGDLLPTDEDPRWLWGISSRRLSRRLPARG